MCVSDVCLVPYTRALRYEGARVDDESYLNRLFWEEAPSTILTSAFMYPEPPSDTTHPWLWSNLLGDLLPDAKPEREPEGKVWERREWQEAFESRVLRGGDCRRQLHRSFYLSFYLSTFFRVLL
jgi:hypothetical protein